MKLRVPLAIVLLTLYTVTLVAAQNPPKFAKYKAKPEKIRNIRVNLKSHKNARMFRTNLRNAAKRGVNFAGHFVLTGWGCGTGCLTWAVIDGRTGRVFFPNELRWVGAGACNIPDRNLPSDAPKLEDPGYANVVVIKPNSRMLIINGIKGGIDEADDSKCGTYFFEWMGTRLKQIKFLKGETRNASLELSRN